MSMLKINVVLRTCDRVSLAANRMVPKDQCVLRCLKSLVNSLDAYGNYSLHIIDDASSTDTRSRISSIAKTATIEWLPERDLDESNNKLKSRYSVKIAYDHVLGLPINELVYMVEDDYLHYPDSIDKMVEAWQWFSDLDPATAVGIFPQDFNQLYLHPNNPFNQIYVRPCVVAAGPDRYYRTTWFTHESFMVPVNLVHKFWSGFQRLLDIGKTQHEWEGSTISDIWQSPEVIMLMPMRTLAIHVSQSNDVSWYCQDFERLWEANAV